MEPKISFVVPGDFASWNDYNRLAGRQRWKQSALESGWKDYAEWHIWQGLGQDQLDQLPMVHPVRVTVKVWRSDRRRRDLSNIFLKPVFDAMTEVGIWPDDNEFVSPQLVLMYMGVDRESPRCEFLVERICGGDTDN